jgi:hypothetical protein
VDQAGSKHTGASSNRGKAGARTGRSRPRVAGEATGCASGEWEVPAQRVHDTCTVLAAVIDGGEGSR